MEHQKYRPEVQRLHVSVQGWPGETFSCDCLPKRTRPVSQRNIRLITAEVTRAGAAHTSSGLR